MSPRRSVLILGNFLSAKGFSRGFIEELTEQLIAIGWQCPHASSIVWRPARLAHMISTAVLNVSRVSVVTMPLFSGTAFVWAVIGSEIARLARTPLVISLHGGNLPEFSRRWPRAVRRVLNSATTVVAPSEYLRQGMSAFRTGISVMPNPIPLDDYTFLERSPPGPRLIWLRSFHAIYNPTLAPRMLSILRKRYPDAHLIMAGSDMGDGSRQATERVAQELGVMNGITFAGPVLKRDVPRLLNEADIFINTTDVDNTPVSVLEAMACGLCVVSTNVGGIPYLLDDGRDALLVPRDDPSSMAAAVCRLIEVPHLARDIAREARRKVEPFDWRTMVRRWDTLLLEAATPRRHDS